MCVSNWRFLISTEDDKGRFYDLISFTEEAIEMQHLRAAFPKAHNKSDKVLTRLHQKQWRNSVCLPCHFNEIGKEGKWKEEKKKVLSANL